MSRIRFVLAFLCLFAGAGFMPAYAAGGTGISSLASTLRTLLMIVISISGGVSLIFAVLHMTKGERDAASKMLLLVIGAAVGVGILAVIPTKNFSGFNETETLGGIRSQVAGLLQCGLCMVAMITLTTNAIKVMQGDQQAARKFFTWLAVSSVGIALLSI